MFSLLIHTPPKFTLFPYTTLFRSSGADAKPRSTMADSSFSISAGSTTDFGVKRSSGRERMRCTPKSVEIGRHTSELQSHHDLVCRLLLEKKKNEKTVKKFSNKLSY